MKKHTILILSLVLALFLSACTSVPSSENDKLPVSNQSSAPSEVKSTTPQESQSIPISDVSLEEQLIFEKDGVRITVKGLASDDFWGPGVKVLVENNSPQNITVQTRNCSVNGLMQEPIFSCDVAAGKKANDTIQFTDAQLETAQISVISNIEFSLHIFNSDTWDDIMNSDIVTLNTSATGYVQTYNDKGFTVVDTGNINIIVQKLNSADSFWGSDVYVYAENNTDADLTIQTRDVSINGFMVEPIFSCDIAAGKKAYDTITFMETDLQDNSITDITELELKFSIFDSDSWEDILNTDIIKITFE